MLSPHDNSVFVYIICGQEDDKNRWEFNQKEMGELKVLLCQPKIALKYCVSTENSSREILV